MKLYDGGKIITGLIIFVGLMLSPFIMGMAKPGEKPDPKTDTPEIQEMEEKDRKCVEPKELMRTSHMVIIDSWRDQALRDGDRVYENAEGKEFDISLQNTCMKCHSNKKKFCDECHNYVAVKPYCWDCHIAPKEKEGGV
jgi:hypothetical protein